MKAISTVLIFFCLTLSAVAQEAATGWLGTKLEDLTKAEADALGWDKPHGVKVVKLVPGSPADAAGLLPGDVLVSLDGIAIENLRGFGEALVKKAAGTQIKLSVRQAGREKQLSVTLAPRPALYAQGKPRETGPQLMLDTGGHMELIGSIAFTPDGKQLVSASDDKTIRVWDVATGSPKRTIRGETAPGHAGKIFAMALSPDGKWLAAGGWTKFDGEEGHHIRLYDFASGRLVALLKGHDDVINTLTFSPDARYLISGSADSTAIIWDVTTASKKHRLRGHGRGVYGVGFTPDGQRAVTGSLDRDLRLWRVADGQEIARMHGHGDKVYSLAVARDGTVASGDDSGEIRLWDGNTGAFRKVLARQGASVGSLSFSPDGALLLSSAGTEGGAHVNKVYDLASGGEIATYRGHDNIVIATAISPDGRWAATAGGDTKEIHIWNLRTGERRLGAEGQPLTLGRTSQPVWAAGFSGDGGQIGWGNLRQSPIPARNPLQYALTLPSGDAPLMGPFALSDIVAPRPVPLPKGEEKKGATPSPLPGGESLPPARTGGGTTAPGEGVPSPDKTFVRATTEHGGWSLSHRKGGNGLDAILDIRRDGQAVASIERTSTDGYTHHTYTFTPDGETVISGGRTGVLTAYTLAGKKLGDFIGHEGDVLAIAPSPDGRYLLSGGADRTVKLWNLKTRELLVTLFRGQDGEWVMWTPQGYFTGSGRGSDLAGWQVNRGPENEAEYVTAGQLRRPLHRPDVVARTIALGSEEAALRGLAVQGFKLKSLLAQPVPRFAVASPAEGATVSGGSANIRLALEATPDPIKEIRIRVNGRQIASVPPNRGDAFQPGTLAVRADLAEGRNEVRIIAVNDIGESSRTMTLFHQGPGDLDKRGTLYLLAIGVDKYPGLKGQCAGIAGVPDCDLRFAGADAVAFADTMAKRMAPLHQKVVRRVLTNGKGADAQPSRADIIDALGILQQAQPNDTVVVFLAGHGKSERLSYRFLPSDAEADDGRLRLSSVVSWFEIREAMDSAKGCRILFLDTFHSGNAYNARLDGDVYHADILTYASARGGQLALANEKTGHGLFTAAIVDGMNGAADRDKDKRVSANELGTFIAQQVQEQAKSVKQVLGGRDQTSIAGESFVGRDQTSIAAQVQQPQMYRGKDVSSCLLAHVE